MSLVAEYHQTRVVNDQLEELSTKNAPDIANFGTFSSNLAITHQSTHPILPRTF